MARVSQRMLATALGLAVVWCQAAEPVPLPVPRFSMPGRPHAGQLPPLEERDRELARRLEADVLMLAGEIGERHAGPFHAANLRRAELFIHRALTTAGFAVERQTYEVRGVAVANLICEVAGDPAREPEARGVVVIGAHYDSAEGTPGANDNASGVAAALALARIFKAGRPGHALRFVFFTNEEPPWFQTEDMGSVRYARRCRERGERIVGMLSLETIGYFSDEPGSQRFDGLPPLRWIYPDTGDFIAFVGNVGSGPLVTRVVGTFRETTQFPAYGCAIPDIVEGVGWSDHWAFWQSGYPAAMVTDTAVFRYPHYHAPEDTADKLDYGRMARVVRGLERVIANLAELPGPIPKRPESLD